MASTPEGRTKAKISGILKELGCWYYMPVPGGYGAPSLDYLCARDGWMFGIEAKAPGKKATDRQLVTIREMEKHNIPCWVEDGSTLEEMKTWIQRATFA